MKYKSQENAVFIAIHPTTYRSGGFLAHGVLNFSVISKYPDSIYYDIRKKNTNIPMFYSKYNLEIDW